MRGRGQLGLAEYQGRQPGSGSSGTTQEREVRESLSGVWIGDQKPASQHWHPRSSSTPRETWSPVSQAPSVLGAVTEAW